MIVFAIGIGSNAHYEELQEIASASEYVFLTPTFSDLKDIIWVLAREICSLVKGKVLTSAGLSMRQVCLNTHSHGLTASVLFILDVIPLYP